MWLLSWYFMVDTTFQIDFRTAEKFSSEVAERRQVVLGFLKDQSYPDPSLYASQLHHESVSGWDVMPGIFSLAYAQFCCFQCKEACEWCWQDAWWVVPQRWALFCEEKGPVYALSRGWRVRGIQSSVQSEEKESLTYCCSKSKGLLR